MKIESYGESVTGRVRSSNEDSFYVNDARAVYAVADGVGGLPRGEEASQAAVAVLARILRETKESEPLDLERIFHEANHELRVRGKELGSFWGIGTTFTVGHLQEGVLNIAHVGDSSLFLLRRDEWEKPTRDHTLEQEVRERPGFDPTAPVPERFHHTLTRCLGQDDNLVVDTARRTVQPGDRIFLCSDGITNPVSAEEIHSFAFSGISPKDFVKKLIALANERGGKDNATGVAVFVDE